MSIRQPTFAELPHAYETEVDAGDSGKLTARYFDPSVGSYFRPSLNAYMNRANTGDLNLYSYWRQPNPNELVSDLMHWNDLNNPDSDPWASDLMHWNDPDNPELDAMTMELISAGDVAKEAGDAITNWSDIKNAGRLWNGGTWWEKSIAGIAIPILIIDAIPNLIPGLGQGKAGGKKILGKAAKEGADFLGDLFKKKAAKTTDKAVDAAKAAKKAPPTPKPSRNYSDHAKTRMAEKGISESSVDEAIKKGKSRPGNKPGTTEYHLPSSGSSTGKGVKVVIANETGKVITVINKGSKYKGK